jgi:hypothetical protein
MANFDFIASANESIKNVSASLRSGNKEYTSLSSVLKDIQRKAYLDAGYRAVFEALGLEAGKVTPKDFFGITESEQWGMTEYKNKKNEKWLGLWGWSQVKDETGKPVMMADGKTPKMEAKLRKITSWTPTKLFKVIAQANAIAASKAEKKAA